MINAIDDDADGLIDLNDDDCNCPIIQPVSLIPNPSFEEQLCCPHNNGEMNCAKAWIQASSATSDYIHSCSDNFQQWPLPQPIPDGNGLVGILNGIPGELSNYKEYIGACLIEPLQEGVAYNFQFQMGFPIDRPTPPIDLTFFGTTDCNNLPFGEGIAQVGCPTNVEGWIELSKVNANNFSGWQTMEVTIDPQHDIYAMAIGPPCAPVDLTDDLRIPYYFFDNLILDDQFSFDFQIQKNEFSCPLFGILEVPEMESFSYQWYRDGIAIVDETEPHLAMPETGSYQVMIRNAEGCQVTLPL